MAITNGTRKILDLKRWEMLTLTPVVNTAGAQMVYISGPKQLAFFENAGTVVYQYNVDEDGWVLLPNPNMPGTFGVGASLGVSPWSYGPTSGNFFSAISGTVSSITVNAAFQRNLSGFSINILSGNNAGLTIPILSSTVSPSSTIFVSDQAASFDSTTTFRINTPSLYFLNAGTGGAGDFKKYDYATNTWVSVAQKPITPAGDGFLVATPSWQYNGYQSFFSALASSGTTSSLTLSTVNWTSGQWQNFQVRIVSGTGAGQIRSIASSTSNTLSLSSNDLFAIAPSSNSLFSIEGNDDYLYYHTGNTSLYRYSIKRNVWETINTSKGSTPGGGMSLHWINNVTNNAWTNPNSILNGRYLYSFRGTGDSRLDVYDIPTNTWTGPRSYSPSSETFTGGTRHIYLGNYIYSKKDATGRVFRYNLITDEMDGWHTIPYNEGGASVGNCAFPVRFQEGTTTIDYLYFQLTGSQVMFRCMII